MCNYVSVDFTQKELEKAYQSQYVGEPYTKSDNINGFANPKLPVILDRDTDHILAAQWGFLPSWATNSDFAKKTLNARMEEVHQKPTYKNYTNNRCLILVSAFHEWKWLDGRGKRKDHYLIKIKNQEIFAIGGLYNIWTDPATDEQILTCTVGTTEANPLMAEIHNTKHRMPILLNREIQYRWLDDIPVEDFLYPNYNPQLVAENLSNLETPTLF